MTIHRPHPISEKWRGKEYDDDPDALLFDDCERCNQLAKALISIDRYKFRKLWDRMISVEFDNNFKDYYCSINEAIACGQLYNISHLMMEHFNINPKEISTIKEQIKHLHYSGTK